MWVRTCGFPRLVMGRARRLLRAYPQIEMHSAFDLYFNPARDPTSQPAKACLRARAPGTFRGRSSSPFCTQSEKKHLTKSSSGGTGHSYQALLFDAFVARIQSILDVFSNNRLQDSYTMIRFSYPFWVLDEGPICLICNQKPPCFDTKNAAGQPTCGVSAG